MRKEGLFARTFSCHEDLSFAPVSCIYDCKTFFLHTGFSFPPSCSFFFLRTSPLLYFVPCLRPTLLQIQSSPCPSLKFGWGLLAAPVPQQTREKHPQFPRSWEPLCSPSAKHSLTASLRPSLAGRPPKQHGYLCHWPLHVQLGLGSTGSFCLP